MIHAVTQEDIDSGIKKSYEYCPLALCLKRTYKRVVVENFQVTVDGRVLKMVTYLQHFVNNFDSGLEVNPFSFPLAESLQCAQLLNLNMVSL